VASSLPLKVAIGKLGKHFALHGVCRQYSCQAGLGRAQKEQHNETVNSQHNEKKRLRSDSRCLRRVRHKRQRANEHQHPS
jgi:hypothetical protein